MFFLVMALIRLRNEELLYSRTKIDDLSLAAIATLEHDLSAHH